MLIQNRLLESGGEPDFTRGTLEGLGLCERGGAGDYIDKNGLTVGRPEAQAASRTQGRRITKKAARH